MSFSLSQIETDVRNDITEIVSRGKAILETHLPRLAAVQENELVQLIEDEVLGPEDTAMLTSLAKRLVALKGAGTAPAGATAPAGEAQPADEATPADSAPAAPTGPQVAGVA